MNQNEELRKHVDLMKASENYGKMKFTVEIAVEAIKCYNKCAEALEWPQLGEWLMSKIPNLSSVLDSADLEASLRDIAFGSGQSAALEAGAEGVREIGTSGLTKDIILNAALVTVDLSPVPTIFATSQEVEHNWSTIGSDQNYPATSDYGPIPSFNNYSQQQKVS